MVFTREDILKIQNALLQLGRKDSEFKDANTPLNSDDYIAILQDGINKKVSINNLLSTLGLLKKDDFINVSDRYDEYYIQLSEAITIIAKNKRKKGLVITFQDLKGDWKIYQFTGEVSNFVKTELWKDLFDYKYPIVSSVLPDEEDLTLTYPDKDGNSFIQLKDKEYDPENFSGMATKILRKNIVEVGGIKKNILTQEDFDQENCIYEIRYDFDLNDQVIKIPDNSILKFTEGSFSNGNLSGDFKINSFYRKIFYNIKFSGICTKYEFELSWFVKNVNNTFTYSSTKKDSTEEIQAAFDCGINRIKISDSNYYYVSKTLILKSNIHLIGKYKSGYKDTSTISGSSCFYTDQEIIVLEVLNDKKVNNKYGSHTPICIDGIYISRNSPFSLENNFNEDIPTIKICSDNGGCWGVYLNVHMTCSQKNVTYPSDSRAQNGYTGIEVVAKNKGWLTYIIIDGFLHGFRRAYYAHTDDSGSWITDTSLRFNSISVYGGDLLAGSPFRISGSWQSVINIPISDDRNSFFTVQGTVISQPVLWDLDLKEGNYTTAKYAFKVIGNSEVLENLGDVNYSEYTGVLPSNQNLYTWDKYAYLFQSQSNLLELLFYNVLGGTLTQNSAEGMDITTSVRGKFNYARLYNKNDEYVDLTDDNISNYNKLFKLSQERSTEISHLRDNNLDSSFVSSFKIDASYNKYVASFTFYNWYFQNLDVPVFFRACSSHTSCVQNIVINYYNSDDILQNSYTINFDKDAQFYSRYICIPLQILKRDFRENERTVEIIITSSIRRGSLTSLPKLGISTYLSANNITTSGGEIYGPVIMKDLQFLLDDKYTNYRRYIANKYINHYFNIKTTYTKILRVRTPSSLVPRFCLLYQKFDGSRGAVFVSDKILSQDRYLSFRLIKGDDNSYQLEAKTVEPVKILIEEIDSLYITKFLDVTNFSEYTQIYETTATGIYNSIRPQNPKNGLQFFDSNVQKPIWWVKDKWVDSSGNNVDYVTKGTTSNRPTLTASDEGFQYYDTTLHEPIWWNGTQWIDGTNTPV